MHSSSFVFAISLLMLAPFKAYAGTATQTDWSGGDGIWGPVIDWGNEFYADTDIECYIDPSNVILQKTMSLIPLEHTVDGNFDAPVSVYSADVDGDGDMDILGASREGSNIDITWWENVGGSGTSWTEHTVDGDFDGAASVYSADVNGDGYMDVLGAAWYADDITWWENVGGSGTSWTEHTVDGDFDGAMSVYSADVNGDGYLDVVGCAYYGGDITWWENSDGSGTNWVEHTVDGSYYPYSVYSADVDGDGDMDVLGASPMGYITWWANDDGSGISWTEYTIKSGFTQAVCVRSADLDGDGDMDVLGAAVMADNITWWENVDGSGTSWIEHIVDGNYDGAHRTCSADVNGDGYLDVLGVAYYADDITWWDLTEFLPDGSLESSVLDVQESPDWETIDWTCTESSGTSVAFQVRASDNSSSMGAWSDTLSGPCTLEGILADEDNYFQYRAILTTTNPLVSPVLHDVAIDWQPFNGTQEGSAGEVATFALFGAQPNPASAYVRIGFAVPEMSHVVLSIYDLIGRLSVVLVQDEYLAGFHQVQLDELAPGIYFCRMVSGEFIATKRFVVIE